ncbi:anthrone oxygenase family protein [Naumannella halotolerans]|uniref:Uncharacterized protein DUF1772 n=1 Tax=Naumannella halotolerans TaxID=993414 RepID=A0A4R7J7V4_9ACTN|nr:anthrone oxygenase family protein [Naumannella halotolerans]TDT33541.1 uncharacterized protein DUF1772 [Naumannella halotolerans]
MTTVMITTVLVSGLLAGAELVVGTGMRTVLNGLGPAASTARALGARTFGRWMPFAYGVLGVSLGVTVIAEFSTPAAVAAALFVLVMIGTLTMMVPLNNRIARVDPSGSGSRSGWQDEVARWDRLQSVRIALLVLINIALLVALSRT